MYLENPEIFDIAPNKRMTRKEKRALKNKGNTTSEKLNFTLKEVNPLTKNQEKVFQAYEDGKNLMISGLSGCGKTFLAMYLALREILSGDTPYKKLIIIRSAVPTRDIGFAPGKPAEKIAHYEGPYISNATKLFGRGDAYSYLKSKGIIEFSCTSFIRGATFENCIILQDEMENLTMHELDSVVTRVGKNCKIIFSGDFRQSDFTHDRDRRGLLQFTEIVKNIRGFEIIDFADFDDIVRSGIVKAYIIAKVKYETRHREEKNGDQVDCSSLCS